MGGNDPTISPEQATLLEEARADLGDRYEDRGLIGEGAMGTVHRAFDRKLRRVVALKCLRSDYARNRTAAARFVDEAQAAAQLQHPGIIPIHDLGELPDGRPYFTMREVSGRDLNAEVKRVHGEVARVAPADPAAMLFDLIEVFRRVCEAVGYAHRRGVIHRDLKPGNILLGDDGEVLVVDWGLAKVVGGGDVSLTGRSLSMRTAAGTLLGTPTYMPPEQAAGMVQEIDTRADVYALGGILYTLLAARRPYDEKQGWTQVVHAVLTGPPRPLREVARFPLPDALLAICARAMARDPEDRFPTAVELAAAIGEWQATKG